MLKGLSLALFSHRSQVTRADGPSETVVRTFPRFVPRSWVEGSREGKYGSFVVLQLDHDQRVDPNAEYRRRCTGEGEGHDKRVAAYLLTYLVVTVDAGDVRMGVGIRRRRVNADDRFHQRCYGRGGGRSKIRYH